MNWIKKTFFNGTKDAKLHCNILAVVIGVCMMWFDYWPALGLFIAVCAIVYTGYIKWRHGK